MQSTARNMLIEPITLYEHIQTKRKITHLDVHKNLPWILFSDKDGNIVIFDVSKKRPIRAFTIQQYFQEAVIVKSLKFFDTNDRKYITNYDLNDYVRIKGIPLHMRSSLIIITLEKYICFYSYLLQNFVKVISIKDLDDKAPVKCVLYNYLFAIVQTEDGNLNIWNLNEWTLARLITKANLLGKPCTYFTVICTSNEDRLIACSNKNGNIILIDISKKDIITTKLDIDKSEHSSPVTRIDFNPRTNILVSLSKNQILLNDIFNEKKYKKITNFEYSKSKKVKGVTINLSNIFNQYSYCVYGKTSLLMFIDLNLDIIQTKIDSKSIVKNYMRYTFDLENHIFQKITDNKPIKILIATFLLNTTDYLILSTNKGVVITKLDNSNQAAIVPSNKLIEINDTKYFFYSLLDNSLIEAMYVEKETAKKQAYTKITSLMNSSVFDPQKNKKGNGYHRFKIAFSYNFEYLSCLDSFNETYSVFRVEINEALHHLFKNVKNGRGVQLEWCPYSPIFAVMTIANFSAKGDKMNQNSSSFVTSAGGAGGAGNSSFSLSVFSISNDKTTQLYEINNIASHLLFGGHFIGFIVSQPSIEGRELPLQINSTLSYHFNTKAELIFYSWNDKSKLGITLSEEPTHIVSADNLEFMVITFNDKYAIYKLNLETNSMEISSMHWYHIIDCLIYENFILIYLTNNGFYFQILTEDNGYPLKMLKFSNETNHYHLKISKKYKEKEFLYHKNHFQQKILGIFNAKLMTCNAFGDVVIKDIDHILFKITFLLQKRSLTECSLLLTMLEKKYIKSVLAIFKYFFNNDEEVLRKIFTDEMVEHFQLYKYLKCFMKDLLKMPKSFAYKNTELILREQLTKGIINREEKKIQGLYHLCSDSQGDFGCLFAKYIDQNNYFKSLLLKERYFEAYVFNSHYSLNDLNPKILNKAFERLNQYQK